MAAATESLKRLIATLAVASLCVFLGAGAAFADARLCRQLEAQLAALSPGGGGGAQYRKYDKAVAAQRAQLRQARSQARGAGCGFSLFGGGGGRCAGLNRTIDKMERNLSALQSKRTQLSGNSGSRRQRNRLLASLDANDCRGKPAARQRLAERAGDRDDRGATLFDRLFGGNVRQLDEIDQDTRNVRRVTRPDWQASGGQYRTLCVRTCDGYYFPISPSSSMRDFGRDQQNCETMCPGTETQIYYQDAAEDDTATMMSTVTGEEYSKLPTAFLYRQSGTPRPAQCGCSPAKNFSVIAGTPPASDWRVIDTEAEAATSAPETSSITTLGAPRTEATAEAAKPRPTTTLPPPGERKVRVVGPAFLPDPEGAIDLRAPAPTKVQ